MPASEFTTDEDVGVDVRADMDVGNGSGRIGRMMSAERRLRKGLTLSCGVCIDAEEA